MLVFIDESGDAGFKFDSGSSRYFVLTAVIFDDDLEAERVALAIKLLKRDLKASDQFEFKFNGTDPARKVKFFQTVAPGAFRVRALIIDKQFIRLADLRTDKGLFYNYAVKLLLKDEKSGLVEARIRLDGHGDREYKKAAQSYLKAQLNAPGNRAIKNVRFVDSKGDMLIQLADMASGAIYRSLNDSKADKDVYISLIRKRIENLWKLK